MYAPFWCATSTVVLWVLKQHYVHVNQDPNSPQIFAIKVTNYICYNQRRLCVSQCFCRIAISQLACQQTRPKLLPRDGNFYKYIRFVVFFFLLCLLLLVGAHIIRGRIPGVRKTALL